jgi:hypothetical protein
VNQLFTKYKAIIDSQAPPKFATYGGTYVVPFFQMGAHGVDHERTLLHQLLAKVFAF